MYVRYVYKLKFKVNEGTIINERMYMYLIETWYLTAGANQQMKQWNALKNIFKKKLFSLSKERRSNT